MDKNNDILLDQIFKINQNISNLQSLMYAQALLRASENSLLDQSKRIELFNSAMTLMGRNSDCIEQSIEAQQLPSNLIV